MPSSLLGIQRERILQAVDSVRPPNKWKVIVLDENTLKLVENCMKLDELLHLNATNIELIERRREPNEFEACYILTPTEHNVRRIIEDLSQLGGGPLIYPGGHVFFIDGVPQAIVNQLGTSAAGPRLRGLVELFLDVWVAEGQVTTGRRPQVFRTLFQPTMNETDTQHARKLLEAELDRATNSIVNTCVMLNEFPIVRYYNPSHPPLGPLAPDPNSVPEPATRAAPPAMSLRSNGRNRLNDVPSIPPVGGSTGGLGETISSGGAHFTKLLAERAARALDDYVQENNPKTDAHRPRGVLFITDRTMDVRAPLMHEFTYQAMLNDLLPVREGKYYHYEFSNSAGQTEEKDAVLNDEDTVWTDIRHLHIAVASQKLSNEFEQHVGKAGKYQTGKSLNDMRDMLANLPQMQETKERLSLHLTLAQKCMDIFQHSKLAQQSMVEQSCATGLGPDGSKPRDVIVDMVSLLDDRNISNEDKVRIIALYILQSSDGVVDEDRKRLFQHARLGLSEMEAVNNMTYLGSKVVRQSNAHSGAERALAAFTNFLSKSGGGGWKRDQEYVPGEYDTARFKPLLQYMLKDYLAGKLDTVNFPHVEGHGDNSVGASSTTGMLANFGMNSGSTLAPQRPPLGGHATSLRSQRPTWANGRGGSSRARPALAGARRPSAVNTGPDSTQQRILCYMVGGMTYSEMRAVYQVGDEAHRDVYIASDFIWTPTEFVSQLRSLAKPDGASAPASGLFARPQAPLRSSASPGSRQAHLRPLPTSSPQPVLSSGKSPRLSPMPSPAPSVASAASIGHPYGVAPAQYHQPQSQSHYLSASASAPPAMPNGSLHAGAGADYSLGGPATPSKREKEKQKIKKFFKRT